MASVWVWLAVFSTWVSFADKKPVQITSAMTTEQTEQAENMLTGLFNITVSYLKTLLELFIWFFTRSDVLGVLVIVTVALFVFGVLKRKFWRKGF